MDCHDQNYLALPGGPCGYKAKSESEETKSLVWLTKCFGAGCGKSLARVLLKEAVVVLGCRFCVPRAVNTVFKAKKKSRGVVDVDALINYDSQAPLRALR